MTIWSMNLRKYRVRKWRLLLGSGLLGLYPISGLFEEFYPTSCFGYWVLPHPWFDYGLYPDSVWLISSDIIPVEDYWGLVLWCRAISFWTYSILSQQTYHYIFISVSSYSFIHAYIACIQISFIHGCIIIQCLVSIVSRKSVIPYCVWSRDITN